MITIDQACDILMTLTLQSGMVCLLAGVGFLLLRKASAASRHLLLTLSVLALLAVPLLALFVPHWQVPLRSPSWNRSPYAAQRAESEAREVARLRAIDARFRRSEPSPFVSSSVGVTPSVPSQGSVFAHTDTLSASTAEAPAITVRAARIAVWQTAAFRLAVLAMWLLGMGIALVRLMAGLIGTWRVTSRETVSNALLSDIVSQLQSELGIERAITVRQTRVGLMLPVPLTCGLFQPTVLLPPAFLEWPRDRQRMVVLHELAHIQRADCLVQALVQITRALYWFHPLVWWTTHRLQAESERACDDTVLLTGVAPSAYAETLLEVIRTMNRPKKFFFSPASMMNMARPPIEARLRAILSPQLRQRPTRPITILAIGGALACATALASVQVKAGQSASAERAEVTRARAADARAAREDVSWAAAGQRNAREAASKSQGNFRSEDAAAMRRKLNALEELLVQNQKENAQLRQQLKALVAQQQSAMAANMMLGKEDQRRQMLDAQRAERNALLNQKKALEAMVSDMRAQEALALNRMRQAEDLYRNGLTSSQEVNKLKADQETTRLRLEAAEDQFRAAQAGHKISEKEQATAQLRLSMAEMRASLEQAQASLKLVQTRYQAGTASNKEVQEAEAEVNRIRVEIDQLQLKLSQKAVR